MPLNSLFEEVDILSDESPSVNTVSEENPPVPHWKNSFLYDYLNHTFLEQLFTLAEQERIVDRGIGNPPTISGSSFRQKSVPFTGCIPADFGYLLVSDEE